MTSKNNRRENLISDEYRALNVQLHENELYGMSGAKYANDVIKICASNNFKTVLDYGCGKGRLKAALSHFENGITVHEYDPAIPGKDLEPPKQDLVVCSDVLEHVEPECLDSVLEHIAEKGFGAYFTIGTTAALKSLPDGRNAHLTIQPGDWWVKFLSKTFDIVYTTTTENIIAVIARPKAK
ncbi:MAG: hypothetical protein P8L66_01140 [Rhodospirillaceae bacterium]|nr:hypothetical protein [Rhodospirillaceae bacterium]